MTPKRTEVKAVAIPSDPIIPVKVETLFLDVNRRIEEIGRNISNLVELSHRKADRTELEKVEEALTRRVAGLEKEMATAEAVRENNDRIKTLADGNKVQWAGIIFGLLMGIASLVVQVFRH